MPSTIVTSSRRVEMNTVVKVTGKLKYNTPICFINFPSTAILSDVLIGDILSWSTLDGALLKFHLYINGLVAVEDFIPQYTLTNADVTAPTSIMPLPVADKVYIGSRSFKDLIPLIKTDKVTTGAKTGLNRTPLNYTTVSIVPIIAEKPNAPPSGGGTAAPVTPTYVDIGTDTSFFRLLFEYLP